MNVRVFGVFVLALGLAVFGVGGVIYWQNAPEPEIALTRDPRDLGDFARNIEAGVRNIDATLRNQSTQPRRDQAKWALGIGGGIAFLGLGLVIAARPAKS